MQRDKLDFDAALKLVRAKRACASPNIGFRFQLRNQRLPTAKEAEDLMRQYERDEKEDEE